MRLMKYLALTAVAVMLAASPVLAQQSDNLSLGALITNASRTPGTVNSASQTNTGARGAICTIDHTSTSGTPSAVFSIDFFDAASATWQKMVTSAAVTNQNVPTSIIVYPGAVATSVPTGMAIAGLKLPRTWRVTQVLSGANSGITGTIGCDSLN